MSRKIVNLEVHVSHSCNLACESCSHFSNHAYRGNVSLDTFRAWSEPWNKRLQPEVVSLLGGEPCIHPQLPEFVISARELWPQSSLRVTTNGLLLHRHPDLPRALKQAGRSILHVTIHHQSLEFLGELSENIKLIKQWILKYGIEVMFESGARGWSRRFKGFGNEMSPFKDRSPEQSWLRCPGKYCRQLFDGKIWKCAPLAYLHLQDEKYDLSPDWNPYLEYSPLESSCSDEELNDFFNRKAEACCSMCPAMPVQFEKPNPIRKPRLTEFSQDDIDPFLMFAAFDPAAIDPRTVQKVAGSEITDTNFQRVDGIITT